MLVRATPDEDPIVARHFEYLRSLTERGTVLLVGRTHNPDPTGFGIYIFLAESEAEAQKIVDEDPPSGRASCGRGSTRTRLRSSRDPSTSRLPIERPTKALRPRPGSGPAMRVAMGGTFDILHPGHEALLDAAFALGGEVFIGLTTDAMALQGRKKVSPYRLRKQRLEAWLKRRGYKGAAIGPLEDPYGPAVSEPFDAIVVSEDRERVAKALNEERVRRGLPPLAIYVVPMVLAEDDVPIASRRIRAKEIDRRGRLLRRVRVNVGSTNPVKVRAVGNVFRGIFPKPRVRGVDVTSKVPEQPFDADAIEGAIHRAREALKDSDYGVGIEAGLFRNELIQDFLDVQYCAVVDKRGRVTLGHGPGFTYPPAVIARVKAGRTVGEAMEELTGRKGIGRSTGAIGFLSGGRMDRTRLTEAAVLMAMVPRIRKDLYRGEVRPATK
jgi:inosine/xanthosine triphosphatase